MKNVCVVVTARPSYSRIRSALFALREKDDINLQLVLSSSAVLDRYGTVVEQVKKDGFEITELVYNVVAGGGVVSEAKTTGLGMVELSTVFSNIKPDYVVTIADRYETMATAVTAAYMNIPLIHIQGGEVTGNIDEKVRHSISKLADIHCVATSKAKERLIAMGEREESIYVTGCPSIDIAAEVRKNYRSLKFDPTEKYNGVGNVMPIKDKYVVVMLHPTTTEIDQAAHQTQIVLDFAAGLDKQVYWFWPNVDAGTDDVSKQIRRYRETRNPRNIFFFKNMNPIDFLVLLYGSECIVGNSSVGIRECSYLGVPAVNIGNREAGRERGRNVIDVDFNQQNIENAFLKAIRLPRENDTLYGNGTAGYAIADVIDNLNAVNTDKRITY